MPYADVERQREYGRRWLAERRRAWFAENGPCIDCGTWDELQLDHRDPTEKVQHRVWSWSEARRLVELAKCVVRCAPCHLKKTIANGDGARFGEANRSAKITKDQAAEARRRCAAGESQSAVARSMGVSRTLIYRVVHNQTWV